MIPLAPFMKGRVGYNRDSFRPQDIKRYIDEGKLEEAKWTIYDCHGDWSLHTQENLLLIIKKLAEINAEPLSPEHEKLNYTLDAAYSLACHIYQIDYFLNKKASQQLSRH